MALREIDGGPNYFAQFSNSLPTDPGFFPISAWLEGVQTQNDVALDKAAGLNLYTGITANSNFSLVQSNGMYVIAQQDELRTNQTVINSPATVSWLLYDEIDMQLGPGQGYTTLNTIIASLPNDGRFTYNNYGKGVLFWETDAEAARFVNSVDVVSADAYWFTDPNIGGGSEGGSLLNNGQPLTVAQTQLAANYGYTIDRLRELDATDGVIQPIWGFVEVGWPWTETAAQGARQILPDEIKAAVWHEIIAGARGIIYFNHSFGGPEPTQNVLRDPAYAAQLAAVTQTNALIEQLAPVLNSPFDDGFVTVNSSVRAMAKYYGGEHYVFAGSTVNGADTGTDTFTLAGTTSGTAVVIGENRTIAITNGQFSDNFADGNAIHIYQISTSVGGVLAGSISINDVTMSEGNSGTKVATFTVTRSGGTAAFDVNYATSNGSATVADSDYVASSNVLRFGANQNTQTISVTITGDTKVEANETFNVGLTNATNGATISDNQGVGTITNDDGAATAGSVSINDVTISEGNSGTKVATFTVTRSGGTAAFDVNYATSNGSATVADSDYVASSNVLRFGANQNTQTISVTITGDTKVEANETFNVGLTNATNGATISDNQGVGTITNDDGAAAPNLVVNGGFESANFSGWTLSGNYGGNQIYIAPIVFPGEVHTGSYSAGLGSMNRTDGILTQSIATTAGQHYTLSFWIESDNDGSTPINHFAAKWNGQTLMALTDAPNSGYQLYTFDVVGINSNSVLEFNGYNSPDAWRLDDVTLTAVAAAPPAAIAGSVSINDVTISESNSGTKVATFTVTRSGGTAAFDVDYATSNGSATVADSDYAAASNVLRFGANQNTQTISVTINGDTKVEGNETFNVGLTNATNGASISDNQGVGTITNDDSTSTPVNDAPTDIRWNGVTPSSSALPGSGTVIANLATADPDSSSWTYSLRPGSSAGFAVSAAGVVTRTGSAMAANATYTLIARSTDSSGAFRDETFNIRTDGNSSTNLAAFATANDDIVYGDDGNDTLAGGAGNDTLFGQDENDTLDGGAGDDLLNGGVGDSDTAAFAAGVANYSFSLNGAGNVIVTDTRAGSPDGADTLNSIEQVQFNGQTFALRAGTDAGTTMTFNSGADLVLGFGGNDILNAGDGDDVLIGGAGNDALNGGTGNDTAAFSGPIANYGFSLNGAGNLVVTDNRPGSPDGADTLTGIQMVQFGAQRLNLQVGNNSGSTHTGGTGADLLLGFGGNDTLDGDGGADILFGGLGNDVFDFNAIGDSGVGAASRDVILDFVSGADDLNFNTIDANTGASGNQNFTLTAGGGTGAFTGAGQIRHVQIDTDGDSVLDSTLIQGNVNSGLSADFDILLQNYTGTIAAGDFIF